MSTKTTGRFAPSPSGRMHLGNAFSCLLAWLSARAAGGRIILRHEDLDPARCRREYAQQIEEDLRWLGLDWDEGGSQGGSQYYQSCRREIYQHYLAVLEEKGLVYPCFCTRADLHAASAPHAADGTPIYSGACRDLSPQQQRERALLRSPALRARVPAETVSFRDGLQGLYSVQLQEDCGDFILRRSAAFRDERFRHAGGGPAALCPAPDAGSGKGLAGAKYYDAAGICGFGRRHRVHHIEIDHSEEKGGLCNAESGMSGNF